MAQRSSYIDQWRGISVLAVVMNHLLIYRLAAYLSAPHGHGLHAIFVQVSTWAANEGMVGVDIFFVISGYLITSLLIREEAENGRISLAAFYVRRCTRIMPAMFAYIGVVALFGAFDLIQLSTLDVAKGASYLCNTKWVTCPDPYSHLWSIGIEEQFYLLWPVVLIVVGRLRAKVALLVLVVAAICAPSQSLLIRGWLNNGLAVYCLAIGTLYALSSKFRSIFERFRKVPTLLLVTLLMLVYSYTITRWQFLRPIGILILPPLVVATVLARDGNIVEFDSVSACLRNVGVVSYSLYLWHAIWLWVPSEYKSHIFEEFSVLAVPFAWLSYSFIEKPFIRLGRRWSKYIIERHIKRPRAATMPASP